jgi:hypothetical protein
LTNDSSGEEVHAVTYPGPVHQQSAADPTTTPVDLATLHGLTPGTGRVQSVIVGAQETLLSLGYPHGLQVMVSLPVAPIPGVETACGLEAIHPLAVRMSNRQDALDCSVLGTSRNGPQRIQISVVQALGLCESGVHTVLCTE